METSRKTKVGEGPRPLASPKSLFPAVSPSCPPPCTMGAQTRAREEAGDQRGHWFSSQSEEQETQSWGTRLGPRTWPGLGCRCGQEVGKEM